MVSRIVKLCFTAPVHLGEGLLESAGKTLCADTLFSALCHEILLCEGESALNALVSAAKRGDFRISDAFPFSGAVYYLPRPACTVQSETENADASAGKHFKKLRFLPVTALRTYLDGALSAEEAIAYHDAVKEIGEEFLQTNVRVPEDPAQDSDPYYVGGFRFRPGCGLWLLLCAENPQQMERYLALFSALGYSGIGGERSSGFGRFQMQAEELPAPLADLIQGGGSGILMSLSVCLPGDDELEAAVSDAGYMLIRRSGFVASETYAQKPQKKNDLLMFAAGSCFRRPFCGDIYDVSVNGSHPVYRYGLPLFISL